MIEFFDYMADIEVLDVHYTGVHHTWCQKPKEEEGLRRKLDRVLSNLEFMDLFHDCSAKFLPRGISDHSPAMLCVPNGVRKRVFTFKFDNFLVDNP